MRAVFRADASLAIGTGHVMRCLTLAGALREQGMDCAFVCREHPGHLRDAVERLGFPLAMLPPAKGAAGPSPHAHWLGASQAQDARDTLQAMAGRQPDWVVVDHYALDAQWESQVRTGCARLLAIDDLADRRHYCDLLLDQNLGRSAQAYAELCPTDCKVLAGPAYALLRPEFAALRQRSLERRRAAPLRHLLVTMGGGDALGMSAKTLEALRDADLPGGFRITVAMGAQARGLDAVRALAARMPWSTEVVVNVSDIAALMADSDLAIGAVGGTAWERCCLGLPTLAVVLADNQRPGAEALANSGAALVLPAGEGFADALRGALRHLLDDPDALRAMQVAAAAVTDGEGTARVTKEMVE